MATRLLKKARRYMADLKKIDPALPTKWVEERFPKSFERIEKREKYLANRGKKEQK